jgi:hypothetical protein
MNSDPFGCFGRCEFSVSQRYTYSTKWILSRENTRGVNTALQPALLIPAESISRRGQWGHRRAGVQSGLSTTCETENWIIGPLANVNPNTAETTLNLPDAGGLGMGVPILQRTSCVG